MGCWVRAMIVVFFLGIRLLIWTEYTPMKHILFLLEIVENEMILFSLKLTEINLLFFLRCMCPWSLHLFSLQGLITCWFALAVSKGFVSFGGIPVGTWSIFWWNSSCYMKYILVEFQLLHEVYFGGIPVATWINSFLQKIIQLTELECMIEEQGGGVFTVSVEEQKY